MSAAAVRGAPLAPAALAAVVFLGAACADPSTRASNARVARPPSGALLDHIGEARVHGDLCGLDGSLESPAASRVVFREEFDRELDAPSGPDTQPWFDGAWLDELKKDSNAPRRARAANEVVDGASCAILDDAAGSLNRYVTAPAGASLLVTARLRVPPNAKGAGLWIIPHRVDAPLPGQLVATVLAPAMENPGRKALLDAAPDPSWREIELFLPPEPGRRSISLSLLPSQQGATFDRVVVRRLSVAAALHRSPRVAFDRPARPGSAGGANAELARVLTLARGATCEALVVPAGASVTFEVDVPSVRPRLQLGAGALGESAGAAAELEVAVDGERVFGSSVPAAPATHAPMPAPKSLDFSKFAGRRIELTFGATAAEGAVGFFSAPVLIGAPKPRGEGGGARRNLLMISLDTLRADVVGCYGDARGLSPAIDAVAAAGRRFATTWSPSCYTLPTHMSVMTGQHPLVHGAFSPVKAVDPGRSPSLAARLRAAGWRTAAFTGGGFVQPLHGFGHGFEQYGVDDPLGRTSLRRDAQKMEAAAAEAAAVGADPLAPALGWLQANADQPFFLFVHTYFVHNYTPRPEYLARAGAGAAPVADDLPLKLRELAKQGDAAALARLRALYAATLAQADETLVRRLLARLDELGLAASTVVCILSDHGEEMLEHGGAGHGHELFQECTRVPWILRGPGVPIGVEDAPVELADVAPTLARLLGLEPDAWMQARDRLAGGEQGEGEDEGALAHVLVLDGSAAPPVRDALVVGPWKLMRFDRKSDELELRLFDLSKDPGEQHDLSASEPARARALAQRLDFRRRELDELARSLPGAELELTSEQLRAQAEAMRELGYFEE